MSDARIGWGGELHVSTDATEANLVELAEVRDVNFPQIETDEHEVTHLKSPDKFKEFIAGLKDGGEFTATLNYVPGGATDLLLTAALGGTNRAVRIVIPDEAGAGVADWNWTLSAFVKRYAPDRMEPNAPITATITFRVGGAIEQGTGETGS
jgi:hypothetical protein